MYLVSVDRKSREEGGNTEANIGDSFPSSFLVLFFWRRDLDHYREKKKFI